MRTTRAREYVVLAKGPPEHVVGVRIVGVCWRLARASDREVSCIMRFNKANHNVFLLQDKI